MHILLLFKYEIIVITWVCFCVTGFIIFPFIWAVPEALVTAELGAAFQDPSAGVAWVEHAFGEGLGGLVGTLAWVSGATGTCI